MTARRVIVLVALTLTGCAGAAEQPPRRWAVSCPGGTTDTVVADWGVRMGIGLPLEFVARGGATAAVYPTTCRVKRAP